MTSSIDSSEKYYLCKQPYDYELIDLISKQQLLIKELNKQLKKASLKLPEELAEAKQRKTFEVNTFTNENTGFFSSLYYKNPDILALKDVINKQIRLIKQLKPICRKIFKIEFRKFINENMIFFSEGSAEKNILEIFSNESKAKDPNEFLLEKFVAEELNKQLLELVAKYRKKITTKDEKLLNENMRLFSSRYDKKPDLLTLINVINEQKRLINQFEATNRKIAMIKFMRSISENMGFFSKGSPKKNIFEMRINSLATKDSREFLSDEFVSNELRYFIFIAVMNRFNNNKTRSGKNCLKLLNDPGYQLLKKILFPNIHKALRYEDLLNRVSQVESQQYKLPTSKHCLQTAVVVFFAIHQNPNKEFNSPEALQNSLEQIAQRNAENAF